jgi:phosphate transport system substrate-binding protein
MKRSYLILSIVLLSSLLLGACGAKPADTRDSQKGTIAISGAFALYPMMTRWSEEYQALHPQVVFDISAGGAGKGMTDVLTGAVEIGMVSREISPDEQAQGAFGVPVTRDAVFPVVNGNNPVLKELLARGVDQATFSKIFITGEITTWGQVVGDPGNTHAIHVYTRSDACGAADTWAKYLGGTQEDLRGIGVSGDPGLLDAVIKDPYGIGYNNLNYAYDMNTGLTVTGSVIIPIDVNQNGKADADELYQTRQEAQQAVASDIYPSPPARLLYLVTNNKPTGIVQAFIAWVLTDGQALVDEAGYIQLTSAQLGDALNSIK